MIVTQGKTNVSAPHYFVDDVGGTNPGEPTTGLLFSNIETGGSASYQRQGAARVDLTLKTLASAVAAHDDGGFILIDDTEMPGVYRCDWPDAAFATGVDFVILYLRAATASNTVTTPLKVDLTTVDLRDGTRGGMTSLPNAAADAAGGLVISDAGGLDIDALNTAAVRFTAARATLIDGITAARMGALTDWIDGGRLDLLLDAIPTTAMRGTDSAALASVCTEGRLAELDAANLPTDIAAIPTTAMRGTDNAALATDLATAQTDLDTITGSDGVTLATAQALYAPAKVADILTTALTEAYAADGAAPTLSEAVFLIMQHLSESSIAGTTKTVKKLDGSTSAATFTLDDATTPTSITRAT